MEALWELVEAHLTLHVGVDPDSVRMEFYEDLRGDLVVAARGPQGPEQGAQGTVLAVRRSLGALAELPPRDAADGFDFGHVIEAMKHTVPDDAVITVDAHLHRVKRLLA